MSLMDLSFERSEIKFSDLLYSVVKTPFSKKQNPDMSQESSKAKSFEKSKY